MNNKLYRIVKAKLMSMGRVSDEEWSAFLRERGILLHFPGDEPNMEPPFCTVEDPFSIVRIEGTKVTIKLNHRMMLIPDEMAIKILALGHLP